MRLVWRINNKGEIRVSLSNIVEYKGFVIFGLVITAAERAYEKMDFFKR